MLVGEGRKGRKSSRDKNASQGKRTVVVGRREKGLLCDPGPESRLGRREKIKTKMIKDMGQSIWIYIRIHTKNYKVESSFLFLVPGNPSIDDSRSFVVAWPVTAFTQQRILTTTTTKRKEKKRMNRTNWYSGSYNKKTKKNSVHVAILPGTAVVPPPGRDITTVRNRELHARRARGECAFRRR